MATVCSAPEQIAKDICKRIFSELFAIGFLDTAKVDFSRPTVAALPTRIGQEALVDAEDMAMLLSQSAERNDAEMVLGEIAGVQVFIKHGEVRIKMRVNANYDVWNKLAEYGYFTGKEAYLYEMNNNITFINGQDSPEPLAYGLPLGMVQVDKPPLFSNGTDPAEFYMMINMNPNLFTGIESAALDFPIHTLDPVASGA